MSIFNFGQEKFFPFRGAIAEKDFFYMIAKPNESWKNMFGPPTETSTITGNIFGPVDPDNTLFYMCLNSYIKSGKKHIRFFWSCDPEDYIPNYNADTKCIGPAQFLHKKNKKGQYILYYKSLLNISNVDQRPTLYPVSPTFSEVLAAGQETTSFGFSQKGNYNLVPNTLYTAIPYSISSNPDFYWRRDYINGTVSLLSLNYTSPTIGANLTTTVKPVFTNLNCFNIEFNTQPGPSGNIVWNAPDNKQDNILKVDMSIMENTATLGAVVDQIDAFSMIPSNGGTIIVTDDSGSTGNIIESMTYTNFAPYGNNSPQQGLFLGVKRNFMAGSGQYTRNETPITWGASSIDSSYYWKIYLRNNNTNVINDGKFTFKYDSNFIQPTKANVIPKVTNDFFDIYLVPEESSSYLPSSISLSSFSPSAGAPLRNYYNGNYFRTEYNYKTGLALRNMNSGLRFFTNMMEGYIAYGTWKTLNTQSINFIPYFHSNNLAFPNTPSTNGKQSMVLWTTLFDSTHQIFYDYCEGSDQCGLCLGYTGDNNEHCVLSNKSQKRYVNSYLSSGTGTDPFFFTINHEDDSGTANNWKEDAAKSRDIYCGVFGTLGGIILILIIVALVFVGNCKLRLIEITAMEKKTAPIPGAPSKTAPIPGAPSKTAPIPGAPSGISPT